MSRDHRLCYNTLFCVNMSNRTALKMAEQSITETYFKVYSDLRVGWPGNQNKAIRQVKRRSMWYHAFGFH